MKKLFSLYDCKAHLFTTPIESVNLATAKRLFRVQVDRAGFSFDDFQVAEVGSFDETSGVLSWEAVKLDNLGGND